MSKEKLYSIQALRAVAASSVVIFHVMKMLSHNAGYTLNAPDVLASGVDLFFLISGFILVNTSYDAFKKPNASIDFLARRIIRVAPLYWLCTTAIILPLVFAPQLFSSIVFKKDIVISSYFFVLAKNSVGDIGTVLQTGWTLCYEFYFYIVLSVLLLLPRKFFLAMLALIFLSGISLGYVTPELPVWTNVFTNPLTLEFLIGAVIAFVFKMEIEVPNIISAVFFLVSLFFLFGLPTFFDLGSWTRLVMWGLPYSFILFACISVEKKGVIIPQFLVSLGDSSYTLYLFHPFILPILGKVWFTQKLTEKFNPSVLGIIAFSLSLGIAEILYIWIEKPVTAYLSTLWRTKNEKTVDGGFEKKF